MATISAAEQLRAIPALRARKRIGWLAGGVLLVIGAGLLGLFIGPVHLGPVDVFKKLISVLPFVRDTSHLTATQEAILLQLRLPRVVLAGLVGATMSIVFTHAAAASNLIPVAAFAGALIAVALAYAMGRAGGGGRTATSLVLAGIAVMSFLTALQTYMQQRKSDTLREVYGWILGRLSTAGWHDVLLILPYITLGAAVILAHRRLLDVLALGDEEADALGVNTRRVRLIVVIAASLSTAA